MTASETMMKAGDLDNSFATRGIYNFPERASRCVAATATATENLLYVSKNGNGSVWVCRINAAGSTDSQFPPFEWRFSQDRFNTPTDVVVHANGKFDIIGTTGTEPIRRQTAISRFNESGSADLIFGTKILPWPVPPVTPGEILTTDWPTACLRSDGHMLVAESYEVTEFGGQLIDSAGRIYCLDNQGNPDLNFNGTGMIEVRFGEKTQITNIAILPDERFIVFGLVDRPSEGLGLSRAIVACYHRDGTLDVSFANRGRWENNEYTVYGSMTLDNTKIVVAIVPNINDYPYLQIHRFLANGSADPSFNNGAPSDVQINTTFLDVPVIAVQEDKKILVAGSFDEPVRRMYWLRVNDTGAPDMSFGDEGIALQEAGLLADMVIQHASDRMIVVSDLGRGETAGGRVPKVLGVRLQPAT